MACRGSLQRVPRLGYNPHMRIGIVQSSPTFGEIESNIQACFELMSSQSANLWVLPELFATGYQFRDPEETRGLAEQVPGGLTTQALVDHAQAHDCHIVAGLPEIDGTRVYNAAVLVGPKGFLAAYRKVHLFYQETLNFAPGDRPFPVIDVEGTRIGMMICFDHLFPESARSLAMQGADVIAHPANLVLPDMAQRTMRTRAVENGVYTATANRIGTETRTEESLTYTGQSQIVTPDGSVLVSLSPDRAEVGVADIDPKRARDKSVTIYNDKLGDRRPDLYGL